MAIFNESFTANVSWPSSWYFQLKDALGLRPKWAICGRLRLVLSKYLLCNRDFLMCLLFFFLFTLGLGLIKLFQRLASPLFPLLTTQNSLFSTFEVSPSLSTPDPSQRWSSCYLGYHERSLGCYILPVPSCRLKSGVCISSQMSTRMPSRKPYEILSE